MKFLILSFGSRTHIFFKTLLTLTCCLAFYDTACAFYIVHQKDIFKGKPRVAILANDPRDDESGDRRERLVNLLTRLGAKVEVIPLNWWAYKSQAQVTAYMDLVSEQFDLLMALGGDDIHPALYNEKINGAIAPRLTRDFYELKLIRHFKKNSKGVFFGICRGHQLGAVAEGARLIQHIENHGYTTGQVYHQIQWTHPLLARLWEASSESRKVLVNSYHHQAVENHSVQKNPRLQVGAISSEDQVIEALISTDLRSISLQFHPEFPVSLSGNSEFSKQGEQFLKNLLNWTRLTRMRSRSCHFVFAN